MPPLQFQESRLENVTFVNCVFTNADKEASGFTSVQMTNVSFAGGRFRNTNGQATMFNKLGTLAMRARAMCLHTMERCGGDVRGEAGADSAHMVLRCVRTSSFSPRRWCNPSVSPCFRPCWDPFPS